MKKNRIVFIDYLRVIAILSVVLCHSVEAVYGYDGEVLSKLSTASNVFREVGFVAGRTFGVPIFLMITGFLLLDREWNEAEIHKFYKKKWLHLLLCASIWSVIYDVFLIAVKHQNTTLNEIIKHMLFLQRARMGHFWYLPMIIGIYMLLPWVGRALHGVKDLKALVLPVSFFVVLSLLLPLISNRFSLNEQIGMGFSGGAYGLYVVTGYLIKKGAFKKVKSPILMAYGIVSFAASIIFEQHIFSNTHSYFTWYDSILVFLPSVTLFELFSRKDILPESILINEISKYSFAIYLTHALIRADDKIVEMMMLGEPLKVLVLFVSMIAGSVLLSWIISMIPKIGNYLIYMENR